MSDQSGSKQTVKSMGRGSSLEWYASIDWLVMGVPPENNLLSFEKYLNWKKMLLSAKS